MGCCSCYLGVVIMVLWRWVGVMVGLGGYSWVAMAGTCCNTPTIWTFKNQDTVAVTLQCSLEKSAAWSGKSITMTTKQITPGSSYQHTWDPGWYADGMGMIPGQWVCKQSIKDEKTTAPGSPSVVAFTTDWGENIHITWTRVKATVARAGLK